MSTADPDKPQKPLLLPIFVMYLMFGLIVGLIALTRLIAVCLTGFRRTPTMKPAQPPQPKAKDNSKLDSESDGNGSRLELVPGSPETSQRRSQQTKATSKRESANAFPRALPTQPKPELHLNEHLQDFTSLPVSTNRDPKPHALVNRPVSNRIPNWIETVHLANTGTMPELKPEPTPKLKQAADLVDYSVQPSNHRSPSQSSEITPSATDQSSPTLHGSSTAQMDSTDGRYWEDETVKDECRPESQAGTRPGQNMGHDQGEQWDHRQDKYQHNHQPPTPAQHDKHHPFAHLTAPSDDVTTTAQNRQPIPATSLRRSLTHSINPSPNPQAHAPIARAATFPPIIDLSSTSYAGSRIIHSHPHTSVFYKPEEDIIDSYGSTTPRRDNPRAW